jgi:adenosylmethionine-8-amino-7-oxononanoate aminotransferase
MAVPSLWLPYTQMQTAPPCPRVVSAEGVYLHLADGRRVIDGIASWWCAIHGYRHPELDQAVRDQLGHMAHVMLGGLVHQGAIDLAAKLVGITPAGLNHVFFGDSGSVGVEIALKMAVQFWANQGRNEKRQFVALRNAYHGDTCGCMSVCDPEEGMHALFAGIVPRQFFVPAPRCRPDGDPRQAEKDIQSLEELLAEHHGRIAAMIVEPLLQAAGGFHTYHPQYLRLAREVCDRYEVLLIFDEVATGLGRTGTLFAADQAGVCPDVMVLGKALTAGYLGHSATLATDRVYEAFLGDSPGKALMHGPTFMGNALACAVALKSIEIFQRDHYLDRVARIESLLREHLLPLRSPRIRDVRVMGAAGVIEVADPRDLRGVQEFALSHGVWLRPFGRYLYTMPPYVISNEELMQVVSTMRAWFAK